MRTDVLTAVPWLTVTAGLPALGALVLALLPSGRDALAKRVGLAFALAALAGAVVMAVRFDPSGGFQFVERHQWIPAFGVHYALGVDGIGLVMVVLTALLTPVVLLASWSDTDGGTALGVPSTRAFVALVLVLETLAIGVFAATDVFFFYVLFEATLIPAYFLIGGYGVGQRSYAAVKFLIYSLVGGLLMLAALVGLYVVSAQAGEPSFLLGALQHLDIDPTTQKWLFAGFFVAFAIKAPMVPVHTWLPDAVGSASPGTSVMLVSVLDKIGTFGMIRLCLTLFPGASRWATPFVVILAVVSIVYAALQAIGQRDIRRLIGYASISHFGVMVLAIFAMTTVGQTGAVLYMISHGLSTAALFLVAGYFIRRRGSAHVGDFGGVDRPAPVLSGAFLFACLSGLALPGLSTFVSEFLALAGTFTRFKVPAIIAVCAIILSALYMLILYQRTMTGPTAPAVERIRDLSPRELVAVAPLVVFLLALGLFPKPAVDVIGPAVESTMRHVGVSDPAPSNPVAVPLESSEGAK